MGIPHNRGAPHAKCVCDECGATQEVACAYVKLRNKSGGKVPNESQARAKMIKLGWSFSKGKLLCPNCQTKKEEPMRQVAKPIPIRQPTKSEKRQIMQMLEECYDTDSECYQQGDTDDTIADVLNVMPAWVVELREEFFGPNGGNEDMAATLLELQNWKKEAQLLIKVHTSAVEKLMGVVDQADDFTNRLERIQKAVGPRNVKKAGL